MLLKILKNKKSYILYLILLCGLFGLIMNYSFSVVEDGVKLEEESELIYYLDIMYDGKDKNYVSSSDTTTIDIRSNNIYIEDRIPDYLIFKGFVETGDGTIGAVRRSGETSDEIGCSGYVVDGVNGLKYEEGTRKVSFTIKELQAGCKLTVGIKTETPSLSNIGLNRVDFYNTASLIENNKTFNSNTVHAYIGNESTEIYSVNYQYTGEVPEEAPIINNVLKYSVGNSITVESEPNVFGYTFSGWTTSDVTVENGKFNMPNKDVTFTGSFTKNTTYKVTYKINGTIPEGYKTVKEKRYSSGEEVFIDSLKSGDTFKGYRFLGWKIDDEIITTESIIMPEKDIEIIGEFEQIKYKVNYEFIGSILPISNEGILPETVEYAPGEEVSLVKTIPTTECQKDETKMKCSFLGWYKEDKFEMPESDVVINGEWQYVNGYFSPSITKEIINEQEYYKKGEEVLFKTTIKNEQSYELKDILIKYYLKEEEIKEGEKYIVKENNYINIPTISAGETIEIYSKYVAKDDLAKKYVSKVELLGGLANDYNYLDTSKKYEYTSEFLVANIELEVKLINELDEIIKDYEYTLYKDETLTEEVSKGKDFNQLELNNTYYLKQTKTTEGYDAINDIYVVKVKEDGYVTVNNKELNIIDNKFVLTIKYNNKDYLPKTLDNIMIYAVLFVISLLILIILIIYLFKKKK